MNEPAIDTILPPEVIEAFTSSAVTALQELTQLEALPALISAAPSTIAAGTVVATMRLLRPIPGSMALVLTPDTARRLAESYLPAGAELSDEIIEDVAAELANVIAGQAKTILKETPYHYTLSIPVVSRPAQREESWSMEISLSLHAEQIQLLIDLHACPNVDGGPIHSTRA